MNNFWQQDIVERFKVHDLEDEYGVAFVNNVYTALRPFYMQSDAVRITAFVCVMAKMVLV